MERTIAVLTTLTVAGVAARPGTAKAPSEPNDRLDTATAPHADGECSTAIETLNDRDFYASTPTGRDAQLTVRLTNDLSESAYENWARWTLNVDIVDAQNEVLLQADASAHADRAAILEVTVPDPSTWYIRAEGRERVSGIPYRFTHTAGSPDRCRWRRVRRPSGCTPRSDLRSPRPRESDGQVNVRVAARCSSRFADLSATTRRTPPRRRTRPSPTSSS